MTSQNDRVVVGNLRALAFNLYFSKANEGFCVCVGGRVGVGDGVVIQHTATQ